MTILLDARPLVDPRDGGVTRVAEGLIPAMIRAMPEARFILVTTGIKKDNRLRVTGDSELANARRKHIRIPNKLFSALTFFDFTSLDRMAGVKADFLFLPNIGFVGKPRIPYALVVHDVSFLIEPRWFPRKARWWHKAVRAKRLIRGAACLFAVSERTKQDVVNMLGIPPNRITVIPLGLPPLLAYSPTRLLDSHYLLALGANDPRKNIGCAIEAVRVLRKDPRFANITLVCTCNPPPTRLLDYSTTRLVTFLRRPSRSTLDELMKNAAAFLYPSWYEGYGLPLHEAARHGTPCVASTAGALPETAPQGTLFALPAKPHEWTTAIKMILENPQAHRTTTTLGSWDTAGEIVKKRIASLVQ